MRMSVVNSFAVVRLQTQRMPPNYHHYSLPMTHNRHLNTPKLGLTNPKMGLNTLILGLNALFLY